MNRTSGMTSKRISQRFLLEAVQRGDSFVYALITRENAVKIGVSVNLMNRKTSIAFGGVDRFIGYMPGDYALEQRLHRSLDIEGVRIQGTREYYYPRAEVLPVVNAMRDWMGVRTLRRRDLPRQSQCTFHRRVMEAQARGVSVFN